MTIAELESLVAVILAISLAAERLVTMLKTLIPSLGEEIPQGESEDRESVWGKVGPVPMTEKGRRFSVQLVAFAACWVSAAFLAENGFDMLGRIMVDEHGFEIPVAAVGFLATGGSTFWKNILGWAKHVRDTQERKKHTMVEWETVQKDKLARFDPV